MGSGVAERVRVRIVPAVEADAAEILALQKLAYESEARFYGDWSIPPLNETVDQPRAALRETTVLKAYVQDGRAPGRERIVGSVRGKRVDATCVVSRLSVHPDMQRQGIGSRLLLELESYFPDVARYELFTGDKSKATIRLYERLGYRAFRREVQTPLVNLVFMEKFVRGRAPGADQSQSM
jgi:ribosomal protein S18 acetylase RimI-like enzyme